MFYWTGQATHVSKIAPHVFLERTGARVSFEIGEAGKSDVPNGMHDLHKRNFAFTQIHRLVLQVYLTDSIFAQPANLFHDVVAANVGRVPHVVVNENIGGARAIHDLNILFGGILVFESKYHADFLSIRRQVPQNVADVVSFFLRLKRVPAKEWQQKHLSLERRCQANGIGHPSDGGFIALQAIDVQHIDTRAVDGNAVLRGKRQIARDDGRVVRGHSAFNELLAERHLDSIEAKFRRKRNGVRVSGEFEIPVGDADPKPVACRAKKACGDTGPENRSASDHCMLQPDRVRASS